MSVTAEEIEEIVTEATSDLRERVDDLEAELADERERRREAEQRADDLEDEVEQLRERVDDAADHREQQARGLALVRGRLSDVEDSLEAVDAVDDGDLEGQDLTPMEQIARLPEHVAAEQFDTAQHRNTFRARSIVRDWDDYSDVTPRGRLLWNRDLCRVLTAQEDGRVESVTGQRVMDRIETMSKGVWVHEQRDGEHVLVLDEPERLARDTVVS